MLKNERQEKKRRITVWLVTVIFSLVFLFLGNRLVSRNLDIFSSAEGVAVRAVVVDIGETQEDSYRFSKDITYMDSQMYFYARALSGEHRGETLFAAQTSDNYTVVNTEKSVEIGDKVMLYNYGIMQGETDWVFGGYARFGPVLWLGAAFFALLILFGQMKGINTIVSLSFTVAAVFAVFVPSVLAGWNVYLMTVITCVYTIVMTLIITNGTTDKSLTTILGCCFGVFVSALIEILFDRLMILTGVIDEHSIYLQYLSSGVEIDLRALIFAMVVIGAMGAVMDVAMDISSSLAEVHYHAPGLSFSQLFKSGLTIGKDVMGTMANTLVLAYIGSSLCTILLLITYSSSLIELLNRESVAVELMQALTGSVSILLTIPLTSAICALKYTGKGSGRKDETVGIIADPPIYKEEAPFFYDRKDKKLP